MKRDEKNRVANKRFQKANMMTLEKIIMLK